MIAKEWRDVRWKFLVAAVLVLLAALVPPILMPYERVKMYAPGVVEGSAVGEMWALNIAGGFYVLLPLAALLGVALISGEVSSGTIFLLLSRPVSRSRLLVTKYAVCAGVLLAAAVLGGLLVVLSAAVRGYPIGQLVDISGVALSALLIWLGSLFVFGVALLASILFRNVVSSIVATVALLLLIFNLPGWADVVLYNLGPVLGVADCQDGWGFVPCGSVPLLHGRLSLYSHWYSESLYMGQSLALASFFVALIAAAVPLLAALWLFRRKAY